MSRTHSLLVPSLLATLALGACVDDAVDPTEELGQGVGGEATVVINEFLAGSSGRIELYNAGAAAADLTGWQVDDIAAGGYAPKALSGSLAPGAHLVINYAGVNTASGDQVRVLDNLGAVRDVHDNFWTGSSIAGLCFGRQPDGGAWASAAIPCTLGATNGCAATGACDDHDACTTGESIQAASCTCGGGTPLSCDDGNPCTAEACDAATGCSNPPVADGTSCGSGLVCQTGACITAPASTSIELVTMPRRDRVLLQGVVVLPDRAFQGEVLVEGDTITCVAESCGVIDAAVVRTHGLILPGLIDTHNHILFDIFDETHWSPTKAYLNHNQWTGEPRYKALVDAKQYLNGEGSPVSLGCEMDKYGELKALISGTTSVQTSANPSDKACYGSLARTVDQAQNGLAFDHVQTSTLFPNLASANSVCANFTNGRTDAYMVHIGEGVDATSRREFANLGTVSSTAQCLYSSNTAIIHGTALEDPEMTTMAAHGMSLVWSPRSNVFLYGSGTDFTKTTDIPLALSKGINVSVAPDWSIGGSQNMLDELRFADRVDNEAWGDQLTPQQLFRMATINPARALGLENVLGSIEVGKKADLMVIPGDLAAPYEALLRATPKDVRLVMVGGVALYGDAAVAPLGPPTPGCEVLDVCTNAKFACVATPSTANKLGQTFTEIQTALSAGLAAYDALDKSPWDFSPITPLVKCPAQ